MKTIKTSLLVLTLTLLNTQVFAQPNTNENKFKQLKDELATPNVYRTASGAPGHQYYQQQADYSMKITLDDEKQRISGSETITYTNNSPDRLDYLWIQLDQNVRRPGSMGQLSQTSTIDDISNPYMMRRMFDKMEFNGGFNLTSVTDASGRSLDFRVVETMLRINLPQPMEKGDKFSFKIDWSYNINDRMKIGGRSGYEYFEEDGNYLYTIAQFYPRMCVYNDVEGWQNKQFMGSGEFTLPFGDYYVEITVPDDHVVAATGELQNMSKVLNSTQRSRWDKAKTSDEPVFIVNEKEAKEAEKSKSTKTKTWIFKAENVRDFGFASSRKFIWDAQRVRQKSGDVMAMSYYPKEGNPLWEKYSTRVVAHTLKVYSKYTFDYPYPVAISVHANYIGMEYPMICFNGGRPNADGTYSERTKYGMLSVIIHEVGHNYFPMIVNSDERQWTWMDEGLNTFLQYLTEQEWERGYPSRRGPANMIVDYMKGDKNNITPIMTNSESLYQFGNNAYGKPATALNILRETILGRDLFDYAFKTYSQRWMFKHPTPADFFRTMEDASGIDLDWFWRGWFYTNDHCDIALNSVDWYVIDTHNPDIEMMFQRDVDAMKNENISMLRNKILIEKTQNEINPSLDDKYTNANPYEITEEDREKSEDFLANLSEEDQELLKAGYNFYQLDFENIGGLVMPLILRFTFEDATEQLVHIPAEIWRFNDKNVSKVFMFEKEVKFVELDPFLETADCDMENNFWPRRNVPSKFDIFERKNGWGW